MPRRKLLRIDPHKPNLRRRLAEELLARGLTPSRLSNIYKMDYRRAQAIFDQSKSCPKIDDRLISLATNIPQPVNPWPTLTASYEFNEFAIKADRFFILIDLYFERRAYRSLSFTYVTNCKTHIPFHVELIQLIFMTAEDKIYQQMKPSLHQYTKAGLAQSRHTITPGLKKLLGDYYDKIRPLFLTELERKR